MRSLTNAPIVVAGVVVGGPLAVRANGPVARVGDTASPEWQSCVEVSLLEGGSSLEGPFAFRPTKQDTHASRVAPTSPAKAADFVWEGGSRVGGRCPAPARAGVCAWASGWARLASPDSAVAAARFAVEAAVPPATYGCAEFGSC